VSQTPIRDISRMLANDCERVATHLMGSDGKREGQELRWGDISGNAGKSLGMHLTGSKRGIWSDFSTGEAGDLLDLWCSARRCDMATAITEAKAFLGIRDVPMAGRTASTAKPIEKPDGLRVLGGAAAHWLREERKISPEATAAYRLVERNGALAMPYLDPSGQLVGMKFRSLTEDKYWAQAGSGKSLFGWQAIPATARTVLICEGELKACAWWDYGFPALSVPFGGGDGAKQDWIENEFDNLSRFDTIHLALDEDEPGRKASEAIVKRLGPERCAIVKHPLPAEPGVKCINGCLHNGISRALVSVAVGNARPRDPDELRTASDYAKVVADSFASQAPEIGIRTPWPKVGDSLIFRPGEMTIIAGSNGHGKSQLVGFMSAAAMAIGNRVCVASLEFRVEAWLRRLVKQVAAIAAPSPAYVEKIVNWLGDGRMWAFDAQGTTDWRRMIDVFRYARRRYAVELFVIDNLTGLGIGEEDYQGQKELALALSVFARDEECHVWLVHHIRKGQSEHDQPDKSDIKGSGSLTDLASTVLTVWRNKRKEEKMAQAASISADPSEDTAKDCDARLSCHKQRNYQGDGNGEPSIPLWWGGSTFQYLGNPTHSPRPMVRELSNASFRQ